VLVGSLGARPGKGFFFTSGFPGVIKITLRDCHGFTPLLVLSLFTQRVSILVVPVTIRVIFGNHYSLFTVPKVFKTAGGLAPACWRWLKGVGGLLG
jgi:hypothetical protein